MMFLLLIILLMTGLSLDDAFVGIISTITNLGQSIHGLAGGYGHLTDIQKLIFIFAMLLGRLEVLLVLVCFLPSFWRRF